MAGSPPGSPARMPSAGRFLGYRAIRGVGAYPVFRNTPLLDRGEVELALDRSEEQLARTVFDVKNAQTHVVHMIEKLGICEPIRWVFEEVTR